MLNFILGKEIASYVRLHRGMVVCALVLTGISTIFIVIPAYLLQPFIDEGMKSGSDPVSWKIPWIVFDSGSWLSWHRTERVIVENITPNSLLVILTLVTFASVVCKSITVYLSELSAAAFSNRAVRSLRIDIFRKYIFLSMGFHQKRKSGALLARATADIAVMQSSIVNILIGLIKYPLTVTVFLIYLFFMNYKLTLLVFLIVPLIIGLIRLFGNKVKKHSIRVQDATADVTAAYQEGLLCLKVVQGFFRGEYEVKRFRELADYLYKRIMRWNRWYLGMTPMLDASVFLVLPAVLLLGKLHFDHTLGELMAMMYAFSRTYGPVKKLAKVNNNLRSLQGATKRIFAIMNTAPDIQDRPDAKVLPRHKKSIKFDRVNFGYSDGDPIIKDVSFEVTAGEMAAFVGSTGAGKSTLMDLVSRFYDVTSGNITIDGIDIRGVTLESLRSQIGMVNQDTILFHDTIANNIYYGDPEKSTEEILATAKIANAHDFIMAQPKGYETVVGDQGTLLSGGQRQRLSIARAILIDPAILVLDEAASALDAESERLVQKSIERLKGTRTILVVAHRLSTIMKANHIYVLEGGRIVESGVLDELLAKNGRFRQLYDMQFSNEDND
ncbi:MAG: ABC transporter ATP-binding protein/permease [Desulfobacterales bacterium]|nr:ABC transporter ATP-binding protein/permease [Desulfobacterales bacterium]